MSEQDEYEAVSPRSDLNKVTPPENPATKTKPTTLQMEDVTIDYRAGSEVRRDPSTRLPLSPEVPKGRDVTIGIFTLAVIAIVGAFVFAGTH